MDSLFIYSFRLVTPRGNERLRKIR